MTRPLLQECHRQARVEWCREKLKEEATLFGRGTNTVVIHIDEKWFKLFLLKRLLYLPPNITREEAALHAVSATQVPKAMFLAAVGYPR